ncbi:MAG: hypothetical protein ACI4EF_05785 [Coprococcus sp.]
MITENVTATEMQNNFVKCQKNKKENTVWKFDWSYKVIVKLLQSLSKKYINGRFIENRIIRDEFILEDINKNAYRRGRYLAVFGTRVAVGRIVENRGFFSLLADDDYYKNILKMFEKRTIRISQYGDIRTVAQYLINAFDYEKGGMPQREAAGGA